MRFFYTALLLALTYTSLTGQQFTLPEAPEYLRTPYAYPHVPPSLKGLSELPGLSNEGQILAMPTPALDLQAYSPEDIDRHNSLAPLRKYLQANTISDPESKDYDGPIRTLSSGYSLRLRQDQRWQLFSPKLKPKGAPFDQLPQKQPFKNSYLACDQSSCQLLDDRGKAVEWAEDYDLLQFTSLGDLVYLENNHVGLLSGDGEKLVPPFATSIFVPEDADSACYRIGYGDRKELAFLRGEDIFNHDLFKGKLGEGRFVHSWHNVLDTESGRLMLDPERGDYIRIINPEAGIIGVVETDPPPGLYPTNKDSLEFRDNVIHLLDLSGKYLTSFWSTYSHFYAILKEGYYRIDPDPRHQIGPAREGPLFMDYNLDFEPIPTRLQPGKQRYFGPDSIQLVTNYSKSFLCTPAGDTLLKLFCDVKAHPIGQDTVLITQRITCNERPEGLEDASFVFSLSRREVIDTLPHLKRLSRTGDFVGFKVHLDANLRERNNEQKLLDGLTEQTRRPVFPYTEKVCCSSQHFYDYAGNLITDDFGNEFFRSVKPVGKSAILFDPRKDCCTQIGYRVLRVAGQPDLKIKPRLVQGYDIGTKDLLGFHYPEVCGGTSVLKKDGTVVLDSTSAYVGLFDKQRGMIRLQFGSNYASSEYLTYDGRFLLPGSVNAIRPMADGSFIIKVGKLYGLVNRQGEILAPVFSGLYPQAGNIYATQLPGSNQKYYLRGGKLLRSRF